ncbi:hypothetical protein AB0M35_02255 [Micromonospora sp. NPDC051196]|uniref:hypothetical protein n=1 Tax=Micromonospora sp. NPDC051196 TaxID=3155281 RepID=UPI0034158477
MKPQATSPVTVQQLADRKGLPADVLARFGVEDQPWGVLFRYYHPDGQRARSRMRLGLQGAGGSAWVPDETEPIVAYSLPATLEFVRRLGLQIIVEGESDCWVAWAHELPAVGIPGGDKYDTVLAAHLEGAREVFVQVEPDNGQTFPDGVEAYLSRLVRAVRRNGFTGPVYALRHGDGIADLSDLFAADPAGFPTRVQESLSQARAAEPIVPRRPRRGPDSTA